MFEADKFLILDLAPVEKLEFDRLSVQAVDHDFDGVSQPVVLRNGLFDLLMACFKIDFQQKILIFLHLRRKVPVELDKSPNRCLLPLFQKTPVLFFDVVLGLEEICEWTNFVEGRESGQKRLQSGSEIDQFGV